VINRRWLLIRFQVQVRPHRVCGPWLNIPESR